MSADMLCLACSSSLPPRPTNAACTPQPLTSGGPSRRREGIFTTSCCNRPICLTCLAANPRLARYNPCLHCLAGVDIFNARRASSGTGTLAPRVSMVPREDFNIDGGLRHEDVFSVGDDEDEDEHGADQYEVPIDRGLHGPSEFNDSDVATLRTTPISDTPDEGPILKPGAEQHSSTHSSLSLPPRYHINPGDTLLGIALKCKVDGYLLCRLNGLPPSTLRTTPHLLHTRTVLTLPPSATLPANLGTQKPSEVKTNQEARRIREQAVKRFQTTTKEVDWRIAKSYVALADVPSSDDTYDKEVEGKADKPTGSNVPNGTSNLEAIAIDRYLDDEEWERRERQGGRGVHIPRFPFLEIDDSGPGKKPALSKLCSGWKWT